MGTQRRKSGRKIMDKAATVKKISYGEAVAERLAHDTSLMSSIDRAMSDVDAHRVYSLEEFARAVEERIESARPVLQH